MSWGLQDFMREKDAWRNPQLLTPIPWSVRRNIGLAVAKLGEALSDRSDCPSEFLRHWEDAEHWLKEAFEELSNEPSNPKYGP